MMQFVGKTEAPEVATRNIQSVALTGYHHNTTIMEKIDIPAQAEFDNLDMDLPDFWPFLKIHYS